MRKTNFLILIIAIVLSACLIGCDGCNGCGGGQDPVNIEEENITIKRIGDTVQLTVTGGNDEKVWSSTDTAVATVTDAGLVTAVANGIAEITVTSAETTDVCVIVVRETVIPEPGLIVTFPKTAVTLNAFMSETYTIVPTITKNNVAVEGATITWTTSDETKATINNGLVTAIANTEAGVPVVITCRAELGGEFAEAKLYVTVEDDTDITFTSTQTLFYTTDDEIPVTALAKINGANAVDPIVFTTSNVGIAKVEGGKIIPVTAGDVVIYANINGKSKGYPIHIRAKYYVDSAEDLKAMKNGSDDVAYELTSNIKVNSEDFVRENIGAGSTKTTAVFLIETLKGEFIGNGYKITYDYDCGYDGTTFTEETFRGLFKNIEATATVTDVAFVGNLRLDHPHMYGFAYKNYGKIQSCYIQTNRRQVAAGTGYQAHYNTAGGVFETNAGIVTDTVIVGNFFAGEATISSTGDNLVMAGTKNVGKFDNVAFVTARGAIGNHKNANWNGSSAMGRDELTYLVRYTDMTAFTSKQGERVTNPEDKSEYSSTLYVRTDCNDQTLSDKWTILGDKIYLCDNLVWEKVNVSLNVGSVDLVPSLKESATISATAEHASQEFTFKSNNTAVVTVNSNGVLTRVGAGKTQIVVTHKVSGTQVVVPVQSYETTYEIDSKAKFLALGSKESNVYSYLSADITLTTADVIKYTGSETSDVFVTELKGALDGMGRKITIDYDSYKAGSEQKDSNFLGVFEKISGKLTGVAIVGTIDGIENGASIVVNNLAAEARVENCFVNVDMTQARSANGNWTSMLKVFGTNNGTVENCIVQANSTDNSRTNGVPLSSHGSGTYTNVAQVGVSHGGAYYNRGAGTKIKENQVKGVVCYTSLANLTNASGRLWTVSGTKYNYTDITTAQDFGSAWAIDQTGIKLYNNTVWEGVVIAITNESDFIEKMSSATESTVLKLTQDLTFTTSHFTKETEANGSTGSTAQYQYDMYLIETFKGTLLGNGYTITYSVEPEGTQEKTTDVRLRGLIEKIESTGKLTGVKIVGDVSIPYSFQTAFCEANYGVVENCYFDVKAIMYDYEGNNINTIGLFGRNDGTIRNSVLAIESKIVGHDAWKGMKMVHNGSDSTSGRFTNIALVQTAKRIGSRNNANTGGQLTVDQLNNVVYYSSLANLVAGTGELVIRTGVSSPVFEYEAITTAQNIGSAWTIDATGIKLNGNYVYQVPTNA